MTTSANFHFKVGALECITINDGIDTAPAESVVKDMDPEQWRQALRAGGFSPTQTTIPFNCLAILTGKQRILVDAGWGRGVQRRDGVLLDQLLAEGITPGDINTIIITHGDVDHIGGILNQANELVFPNAGYILLKESWAFWSNEALLARWPEPLTFFGRKTLQLIRDQVTVVEAAVEFMPGFRLISAPGHRPGHTAIAINSSGERLIHLADTVGHPLLMEHPAWHWYADFNPGQAEKDKQHILSQAAALDALVFGPHLPFPGVGRIIPQGEGWRWMPFSVIGHQIPGNSR